MLGVLRIVSPSVLQVYCFKSKTMSKGFLELSKIVISQPAFFISFSFKMLRRNETISSIKACVVNSAVGREQGTTTYLEGELFIKVESSGNCECL